MIRKRVNVAMLLPAMLLMNLIIAGHAAGYNEMDDDPSTPADYTMPDLHVQWTEPGKEPEAAPVILQPEPLQYKVSPGDTLYKIARSFDISVSALMAENGIANANRLQVGQQLSIPSAEAVIPLPDGRQKVVTQVLSSTLTAYTAGKESTGKSPSNPAYGITYSGSKAEEGRTIAVDPSVIPIGTTVYIDGIGLRTAEDTGSAVKGARIDVFMEDRKEAIDFGVKKNVKVYVLS